jgi:hypothetical protein
MPAEGIELKPHQEMLRLEEITNESGLRPDGCDQGRMTGGERDPQKHGFLCCLYCTIRE